MSKYITTPIYYVNDKPHIGHAYTTTICDVYARYMRFAGEDVFFLTGTDEHGVKVEQSAAARDIPPQQLADENAAEFESILNTFGLTNDDFIRTTQRRHIKQVQQIVQQLLDQGDLYRGDYEGWYDEGQEEFIPDNRAKEQDYKSVISGRDLIRMKEVNYFFKLSAYQDRLTEHYQSHPNFVQPEARQNEMLARLRDGLNDIPISRTSFSWGIPVPGNEEHVLWVWIDALPNYITTLGLIDPSCVDEPERKKYWPANYHVIGKEILFFHSLFWPAVLMALDLPLPQCVYAHSFWVSDGKKMSKSLGNFIDLPAIQHYLDTYSLDGWRYYMATQGPLGAQDADFSAEHFHEIYSAHLVNTIGNCGSRVTAMIGKYFDGQLPGDGKLTEGFDWPTLCDNAVTTFDKNIASLDLASAIEAPLQLVRQVDAFIHATEPFKLIKNESKRDEVGAILYQSLETLRIAMTLLWAVIPGRAEAFWKAIGCDINPSQGKLKSLTHWGGLSPGTQVEKVALFPRVELSA